MMIASCMCAGSTILASAAILGFGAKYNLTLIDYAFTGAANADGIMYIYTELEELRN